jgi:hypothetical protein
VLRHLLRRERDLLGARGLTLRIIISATVGSHVQWNPASKIGKSEGNFAISSIRRPQHIK